VIPKFSYNNWVYSCFLQWRPSYTLEETVKRLSGIGYDAIEIGAGAPHAWPGHMTSKRREEIRQLLEDHKLALSSMLPAPSGGPGNNPVSPLPEEREQTVAHYKELAELCALWGGKTLIYLPGWMVFGIRRRQAWEWSREALKQIADHAAEFGVTMVVEPTSYDTNLCVSADDAIELMQDVGRENVKLMFDTFHVLYQREVPADYAYTMGKDLKHIHLSDNDRLAPGQGRGDWVGLADALIDIEFDGYLTMETGFSIPDIQPDLDARQALEFLRPLFEQRLALRKKH